MLLAAEARAPACRVDRREVLLLLVLLLSSSTSTTDGGSGAPHEPRKRRMSSRNSAAMQRQSRSVCEMRGGIERRTAAWRPSGSGSFQLKVLGWLANAMMHEAFNMHSKDLVNCS